MRHLVGLVLALACSAQAQTFSKTETLYTGGPKTTRFGFSKPKGTGGAGAAYLGFPVGTVGCWDLGNANETIRGGYDLNGSSQYFAKTTGGLPCVSGGAPQYPFSVVVWFNRDATTNHDGLMWIGDATGADDGIYLYCLGGSTTLEVTLYDEGVGTTVQATSAATTGTWHCAVLVCTAANSYGLYASNNTTGATGSTSKTITDIDRVGVGAFTGSSPADYHDGRIAYTAVLPVALSANQRTAIYAGADPVLVAGYTYGSLTRSSDGARGAVCKLDNDSGADAGPNDFDLTASGSPTAQSNLIVVRDMSGGGYHVKATTAAPTYSTSIGNGQGGGVWGANAWLEIDSTPISVAPIQVYGVAQADNVTGGHPIFWLGDKDVATDFWSLQFSGSVANDPTQWTIYDSTTTSAGVDSYAADTNYLLWGMSASSTSHEHQRNGSASGSSAVDKSPDGSDKLGMGRYMDSSPDTHMRGEIHYVLLLNVSSTTDQSRIERFFSNAYSLGF